MYTKVINPATHGTKAYANTGSARRATNYLEQEAKANNQPVVFFSSAGQDELTSDEVVKRLDANHGKLGKDAPKFYSVVLSPSQQELLYLDGGERGLIAYARSMMQTYAENFALKSGRKLDEPDLVWAATLHRERKYRGTDEGLQGEQKVGLQTHVHIIVSALDATQRDKLNPLGKASHFSRVHFQGQGCAEMDERTGRHLPREVGLAPASRPERVQQKVQDIQQRAASNRALKVLTPEQQGKKDTRLDKQVTRLNLLADDGYQLQVERVKQLAREANYDTPFFSRLQQLGRRVEQGNYPPDPYRFLRSGTASQTDLVITAQRSPPIYQRVNRPARELGEPAIVHSLTRAASRIAQTLPTQSRTQDVSGEQEKTRGFEYEM